MLMLFEMMLLVFLGRVHILRPVLMLPVTREGDGKNFTTARDLS
jgi:hypothetical protein